MIFCTSKIFAKVWSINIQDKYADLRISTSEKNKDGEYVNSTWFPRLMGHGFNALKDKIKVGDKLVITKCKFTNEPYKTEQGATKSYFRMIILDAEIDDASAPSTTNAEAAAAPVQSDGGGAAEESPW